MEYHYRTIRMAKIQNTDNSKCWRAVEYWELLFIADWMQNYKLLLEYIFVVSYITKHTVTIWFSNQTLWIENIYPHKKLYTHMYSNFIHNCQNVETAKNPSVGKLINCGTFNQWNIIQHLKEMSYQAMKRIEVS